MESEGSNLRTEIDGIMADVNAVLTTWHSPDGPYDPMPTKLGVQEMTSQDETPQVYWIPVKDEPYAVADEQPDDGMADYQTWTTLTVRVWGSNLDEAIRIRDAVLTKGGRRYGKAFKPAGGGTYSKGLDAERGVMITFAVALKYLIIGEQWQLVTIGAVATNVIPEPGEPPPVAPTWSEETTDAFGYVTPPAVTDAEGAHGIFVSHELGVDSEPMQQ